MKSSFDIIVLTEKVSAFSGNAHASERSLALAASAIVAANEELLVQAFTLAHRRGNSVRQIYELILQSYLFLGFPRMLISARVLADLYPDFKPQADIGAVTQAEAIDWYERGIKMCKRVYGANYDTLKGRVIESAPEIFRWMIVEGYGKVLSRPHLEPRVRELCIIAFLMVDFMPKQLHSHLLGALALGVEPDLLRQVVDEIGAVAPEGYEYATNLLSVGGSKY